MTSSKISAPESPTTSTEPPRELTMDERADQLVQQALRNLRRAAQRKQEQAGGDLK
ncbi:MAG TPA: hypothetical protein VN924_25305 [Bryobacteraceae bacterium]|nr:hypothetical protein [Bryobacteraceae bacterium]